MILNCHFFSANQIAEVQIADPDLILVVESERKEHIMQELALETRMALFILKVRITIGLCILSSKEL